MNGRIYILPIQKDLDLCPVKDTNEVSDCVEYYKQLSDYMSEKLKVYTTFFFFCGSLQEITERCLTGHKKMPLRELRNHVQSCQYSA